MSDNRCYLNSVDIFTLTLKQSRPNYQILAKGLAVRQLASR